MFATASYNVDRFLFCRPGWFPKLARANHYISKVNAGYNLLDDCILKIPQYGAILHSQVAKQLGDEEASQRSATVANFCSRGRVIICATRFWIPLYLFFTGQTFWQTYKGDWRRVACDSSGKKIRIPLEELNVHWFKNGDHWEKQCGDGRVLISSDGKYIEDPVNGRTILKDWMDIAMDLLTLAVRIIVPIRLWCHNLSKSAAKALSGVSMALWGVILSLNLIQAIRDLNLERDVYELPGRCFNAVEAGVAWAALPFDFGLGASHPILAIVGAIINLAAAILAGIKERTLYCP